MLSDFHRRRLSVRRGLASRRSNTQNCSNSKKKSPDVCDIHEFTANGEAPDILQPQAPPQIYLAGASPPWGKTPRDFAPQGQSPGGGPAPKAIISTILIATTCIFWSCSKTAAENWKTRKSELAANDATSPWDTSQSIDLVALIILYLLSAYRDGNRLCSEHLKA